MDEHDKHCCSVMLIVTGEDLDPDFVTQSLGLKPDRSWRFGERRSFVKSDGSILLFESMYDQSGWKCFLPEDLKDDRSLNEQLEYWLAKLRGFDGTIKEFTARGWEVELNCFASGSEVFVLSNSDLNKLSELGLELVMSLYPGKADSS